MKPHPLAITLLCTLVMGCGLMFVLRLALGNYGAASWWLAGGLLLLMFTEWAAWRMHR